MKIDKAVKILEDHNKWRRDNNVPAMYPPTNSQFLGLAIDTVVEYFRGRDGKST